MAFFRCSGGNGIDLCQVVGSINCGNRGTTNQTFTINNVRPGKRLLFWLDNGRITPTSLTVNINDNVAETIFNNQKNGKGCFALVKPKTGTLTGKITASWEVDWNSFVFVIEVPEDLEGIIKPLSGNNVLQDLSELGVPPFHLISSQISSFQEPIDRIQKSGYLRVDTYQTSGMITEIYCKDSFFTPTWTSTDIGNWIMY